MRKWYVFDKFDCFDDFETAEAAAKQASILVANGEQGVHIAYMTEAEHIAYCENGKFPFSK